MHQIFALLVSLVVALCHHTSLTAQPVEAAELPGSVVLTPSDASDPQLILPNRYELARHLTENGSYPVSACISCRRLDPSISNR